jgi:hypothetical protein
MFCPYDPLLGYVFVPSGNILITWSCCNLAHHLYAIYCPKSQKRLAAQIGLHVPKGAFEEAKSNFEAKRARVDEKL